LGCEVPEAAIFFSSGKATGVPSGDDLSHFVRMRAEDSALVVAIISPTFQTRPYCIAELGAAWGISGKLFPILVPGMKRTDLEGVLPSVLTEYLDGSATLDELFDRVCETMDHTPSAKTWGQRKAEWLANVSHYTDSIPRPTLIIEDEYLRALADAEGAREALRACGEERTRLTRVIEEIKAAKDRQEIESLLVPEGEHEAFEQLVDRAEVALSSLPIVAREGIWYEVSEGYVPPARPFDDERRNDIEDALEAGYLVETFDVLRMNEDVLVVEAALRAVRLLHEVLQSASDEFAAWFRNEYGASPDLTKRMIWDKLF
jgi:hypothetical protein